jgi:hypothetical protein
VVVFDVDRAKGRVLVAADADGKATLVADGKKPRHLFWVDAATGKAERVTQAPLQVSWPRVCGESVVFVEGRKDLVLLGEERRTLLEAKEGNFFQPVVSPEATYVAVLEAKRLGVTGSLRVIDLISGELVQTIERAMLGSAWTKTGELLVPRSRSPRSKAFTAGEGEIVQIDFNGSETVIFRGDLPGVTMLADAGEGRFLGLMHLEGPESPLGLAQFVAGKRGAKRGEKGVFDFWPSVSPDAKRLLFVRSAPEDPKLVAELRLAPLANPARSVAVDTVDGSVGAPQWVGADRIAFIQKNHLVLQDLDGSSRIDVTPSLRSAFSPEESK